MPVRNLIVTCGTSQLGKEKLLNLIHPEEWDRLVDGEIGPMIDRDDDPDDRFQPGNIAGEFAAFERIKDSLLGKWGELGDLESLRELNNPFGAELTTMQLMLGDDDGNMGRKAFDPKLDHLTILSSETEAGVFCAVLLAAVVCDPRGWGMDPNRIHDRRVPGLKEAVDDPRKVDQAIYAQLLEARKTDAHTHAIVYTGGFKATIPALTIAGLVLDMKLYSRFERSPKLRVTDVPVTFDPPLKSYLVQWLEQLTGPSEAGPDNFAGRGASVEREA